MGRNTGRDAKVSFAGIIARTKTSSFFRSFFHYGQYCLSLMQSVDLYKMVNDPLKYSEFCNKQNILKLLALGVCACFFMAIENVIEIIAAYIIITDPKEFAFQGPQMLEYLSFAKVLRYYSQIKFSVAKLLYSVMIIIIATRTRKALKGSADMSSNNKNNKGTLYRSLFFFTLIPLGLNFWYLFSECLDEIWPLSDFQTCQLRGPLSRKDIRMYISSCTATVGSFTYFVAFPLLFPKVKQSIMCVKE